MIQYVLLLPQLFTFGRKLAACIEGGATATEIREAIDALAQLATDVPEVRGMLIILQPLLQMAKVVLPGLLVGEKAHMFSEDELRQIQRIVEVLGPLANAAVQEGLAAQAAVDGMSDKEKLDNV
jgi:hypothetical protein